MTPTPTLPPPTMDERSLMNEETSWKGIPHFVVKYRLQQEEITEAKLNEHVATMKNYTQSMAFVLENIDEFLNKYNVMMK